jgi:hypothetical protein
LTITAARTPPITASEMRSATQLGRMLVQENSRVLVLTTSTARARDMARSFMKSVGLTDTVVRREFQILQTDGGSITFHPVYVIDSFLEEVKGLTYTNIVYDMMLGVQVPKLVRCLKPQLRSPNYRGTFTIEPLED